MFEGRGTRRRVEPRRRAPGVPCSREGWGADALASGASSRLRDSSGASAAAVAVQTWVAGPP